MNRSEQPNTLQNGRLVTDADCAAGAAALSASAECATANAGSLAATGCAPGTGDAGQLRDAKERWYVAQVAGGREETTLAQCRKLIDSEVLKECFAPEAEYPWKTKDGWEVRKKLLFPGYLFYVTSDVDELYDQLARVPAATRLLGNGAKGVKRVFFPLTDDERDWFLAFTDRKRVVRMSEGYIEGDTVKVTSGPLRGHEASIRKIDRHKRRAYIDVSLFGRTVPASVGLEILWKSQVA